MAEASESLRATIDALWRIESPKVIGGLLRWTRDVDRAEELAHDALVQALERWPRTGVPANPGAWLMATAKNRAIDSFRWNRWADEKGEAYAADVKTLGGDAVPSGETALDEDVGEDLLRLILIACHPVLSPEARAALTLRLLGGLSTEEIARAFLTPAPTIAQRIVRAKRTLAEAKVTFEVPRGTELLSRLSSVLDVLYLIFNEGYSATAGDDWMRPSLCEDAMRLGRVLAGLVPEVAEVHGLVALMELHASRMRARLGPDGQPVLLPDQDRTRWDRLLIQRGLAALARAESLQRPLGPFTLQAAISACHARALTAEQTDWPRIVALYDALVELTQSPVVALNRAVAVGMAFGAQEALELVDELADDPALRGYHWLPSVRGDLLFKLGRKTEAKAEFERAATMTQNAQEKSMLLARASQCAAKPPLPRAGEGWGQ